MFSKFLMSHSKFIVLLNIAIGNFTRIERPVKHEANFYFALSSQVGMVDKELRVLGTFWLGHCSPRESCQDNDPLYKGTLIIITVPIEIDRKYLAHDSVRKRVKTKQSRGYSVH